MFHLRRMATGMPPKKKTVGKLGIYVPPRRRAELEEMRGKINFSELFWDAFDSKVRFLKNYEQPDL